jgi:hypothetical protein
MTTSTKPLKLGSLTLKPVAPVELAHMRLIFESKTLPKIREDQRRNAQNVAQARQLVAFG